MSEERVGIQQATTKGYIECDVGGVADLSYPGSKTRRGRVEHNGNVCPTITSQSMGICRIEKPIRGGYCSMQHKAIDEQNMRIREESFGTLTTDGSTPKHNNRVLEIERTEEMSKIGQISTDGSQCGSVYADDEEIATLTTGIHGDANSKICTRYRIRKLTPIECWRLMDFSDDDFRKAEAVNSNTQLYKQAGNSIVCNVLVAILGQLFEGKEGIYKDCQVKRNFFEENV